jgi:hypothetical protein
MTTLPPWWNISVMLRPSRLLLEPCFVHPHHVCDQDSMPLNPINPANHRSTGPLHITHRRHPSIQLFRRIHTPPIQRFRRCPRNRKASPTTDAKHTLHTLKTIVMSRQQALGYHITRTVFHTSHILSRTGLPASNPDSMFQEDQTLLRSDRYGGTRWSGQ